MADLGSRSHWRTEWWVPAAYLVISGFWIYGSDTLVAAIAGSIERQHTISVYKGFGFVIVSAALLHAGLRWALRRERASAQRVQESEALLRAIANAIPDPVFLKGRDGRWLFSNPATLKALGKSMDQVIGRTDAEIYGDPVLSATLMETDRRIMAAGESELLEERVFGPQGFRTFLSSKAPYRNADGRVVGIIGTARDITDRKQAELQLVQSHELLANLARLVPGVIYQYRLYPDGHSNFPYASPGMNDIYEVTPEEVQEDATPVFGRLHPEDYERVAGSILESARTLAPFFCEFRVILPRQGLGWRWSQAHPERMADGGTLWHGIISDITQRKEVEEALRESEARFASIAENSPVAIYRYSDRRGGLYYSPRSKDLWGYSPEELLANPSLWTQAIRPEDLPNVEAAIQVMLSNQTSIDLVYRIRHASGQERWLRDRARAHRQPDGEGIVDGVAMDITDFHQAEEEKAKLQATLQQAQKMENLGSLAGGVAHDMNNVLGAILGLASANLEAVAAGSPTHQAFQTIIRAAERGGKMVKGLLTFARQSPAEERELDMNELLQEEARLLERTTLAKIRLAMDLASDLRPIRGDASALTHTFMNLCVNAVDAMPENGTLTLRTRNVDLNWVEVAVEDTGTGMPKEVLEKALDPFFTTKGIGKGTGLGLSMVYSTVKAHQGQIEIQSEPGQGTCVRMRFPACEPAGHGTEPEAEPRAESSHRALTVLVVDDDELIRCTLAPLLGSLGHSAVAVSSGEEALTKLATGFRPDVIILDMNMPGLGGAGTLPQLRRLRPTTPVLLATGRVDESATDLIKLHSNVTLLSKPFSLEELKQCLETLGRE